MSNNFKQLLNSYFLEFVRLNQEELFMLIWDLIEIRIKIIFPDLIKQYLPEIEQKVNIDIEASVNGRKTNILDDIKESIVNEIVNEMNRR